MGNDPGFAYTALHAEAHPLEEMGHKLPGAMLLKPQLGMPMNVTAPGHDLLPERVGSRQHIGQASPSW
jgi:hypothetical protein